MHGPERTAAPPAGPHHVWDTAGARRARGEHVPDPFASGSDDTPPDAGPEFYADYDGDCEECGEPILAGELIRGVGGAGSGEYIHSDCYEDWCSA